MTVLYTAQGPFYGIPFRFSTDLRDGNGDLVSLASPDSEISKDLSGFSDTTNEASEGSMGAGYASLDLTAADMTCGLATLQMKGTNHKTFSFHLVPKFDVIFIGTLSAFNATGADTLTLNTTDQLGDTTNGHYDGCFVVPISGTGVGQNGRYASTDVTYVGSTKVITMASDFIDALDTTTVVMIHRTHAVTVTFPTNFADMAIAVGTGLVSGDMKEIKTADADAALANAIDVNTVAIDLTLKEYFALLCRSDTAIITDLSVELAEINENFGGGAGNYSPATDSLEAIDAGVDTTEVNGVLLQGDGTSGDPWRPA